MTSKADWRFRADFLRQQATYLEAKAAEFKADANRYLELSKQAQLNADGKNNDEH